MTIPQSVVEPKYRVRVIRFPEDEVSLHVKWTQFVLYHPLGAYTDARVRRTYRLTKAWCIDQFGPEDSYPQRWRIIGTTFCIQSDTDSAAFRLRWC